MKNKKPKIVVLSSAGNSAAEVKHALDRLRVDLEGGRLIGLAWVAMYVGGGFAADAVGAALNDPAHTAGLLQLLNNRLLALIER